MERHKRTKKKPLRLRSIGEGDQLLHNRKNTQKFRKGGKQSKGTNNYVEWFERLQKSYRQQEVQPNDHSEDEIVQLTTGTGIRDQVPVIDDLESEHSDDYDNDQADAKLQQESQMQGGTCRTSRELLNAAKESLARKQELNGREKDISKNSRRLTELEAKQDTIKASVDEILQLLKQGQQYTQTTVPPEDIVDGIDVIRMPTRDAYSFGLELLDKFFTPEELARSLVYKSKRSDKEGLDKEKVERMMSLIKKRFSDVSMKLMIQKMNQKCIDKARSLKFRRNIRGIDDEGDGNPPPGSPIANTNPNK